VGLFKWISALFPLPVILLSFTPKNLTNLKLQAKDLKALKIGLLYCIYIFDEQ